MENKSWFRFLCLIFISFMISGSSFSRNRSIHGYMYTDTISKDSLKPIIYIGLSKYIVEYLESQHSTKQLSQHLFQTYGVEIDSNQAKLLDVVASNYGLQDIIGDSSNEEVLRFFAETNHPEIIDDETSWCSTYMCWCAQIVNLENSPSLLARSWLEIGTPVDTPKVGDIVVFWREKQNSWQGHVSVYINEDSETHQIYCLGGNQDDKVCVKPYPSEQVLGYRRLNVVVE